LQCIINLMLSLKPALTIFISVFVLLIIFAIVYQFQLISLNSIIDEPIFSPTPLITTKQNQTQKPQLSLTNTQKLSQILMTTLSGYKLTEKEIDDINTGKLGNIILLSKNIHNAEQLKQLTSAIYQQATFSGMLPLIAVDQEGGAVSRIPWIENTAQNQISSEDEAYQIAWLRGQQLKELGVNTNFAPVIETANQNSFIAKQKRGFASQSAVLAQAMVRGYQQTGILAVVKHFPAGLGRVDVDPHRRMPVLNSSEEEIISDIMSFIDLSASAIMVTHLLYPLVDATPTSASRLFLEDILRDDLAFDGLIISDDLSMGAIKANYLVEDYAQSSLQAGTDLLIITSSKDYQKVYDKLLDSCFDELGCQKTIDQHIERVLKLKRTLE